jgi:hypothetical protein
MLTPTSRFLLFKIFKIFMALNSLRDAVNSLESLQHGRVLADEIANDSSLYIKFLQGEGKESLGVCNDFFHKG